MGIEVFRYKAGLSLVYSPFAESAGRRCGRQLRSGIMSTRHNWMAPTPSSTYPRSLLMSVSDSRNVNAVAFEILGIVGLLLGLNIDP